ncbi:MAG TPA: LysE family transporter [Cyclobacteriaceae bacterium]|nr:LysE family transporter [Cyclobacteriaceae bacterium]
MDLLQNFLIAFLFSFLGSIPPGTLNLTVLQLGLEKKINIAWRFAAAAAFIEYPYAWLAVAFESYITASPMVLNNFKLISAVVMIALGGLNIWSAYKPTVFTEKFQQSGFRRGVILGILNPLALPFWIAVTAYLSVQGWIDLTGHVRLHLYLLGVSVGAFSLFMLLAFMAKRMVVILQPRSKVKLVPGIILLALGLYAFVEYLL